MIPVPRPPIACAQLSVACGDLLCAAGVLYVLLPPQAEIGFVASAFGGAAGLAVEEAAASGFVGLSCPQTPSEHKRARE